MPTGSDVKKFWFNFLCSMPHNRSNGTRNAPHKPRQQQQNLVNHTADKGYD